MAHERRDWRTRLGKQGRDGARERKWGGMVDAWRRSGLSQTEFCRREGVSLPTFNYWKLRAVGATRRMEWRAAGKVARRRRSRIAAKRPQGQAAAFLPVRVVGSAGPAGGAVPGREIEILLRNGRRLRAAAELSPEIVVRWVGALEREDDAAGTSC